MSALSAKPRPMLSALLMLRRVGRALRYAAREEDFLTIFGAGVTLVIIGTVSYSLGEGWNVVDGLYFAVSTLTTTSVADPDLVLEHGWMKVFTVLYLLIGIGILVEILRRLGLSFVAVRAQERAAKAPRKHAAASDAPAPE
jgi:voltage-gated potassium channel